MNFAEQDQELRRKQELGAIVRLHGRQGGWRLVMSCLMVLPFGVFVFFVWGKLEELMYLSGHVLFGCAVMACAPYAILMRLRLMKAAGRAPDMLAKSEGEREFYYGGLLSMRNDFKVFNRCMMGLILVSAFFLIMASIKMMPWPAWGRE